MIAAGEQAKTHHYKGKWRGFGPIGDEEIVLFAVFRSTPVNGNRLVAKSFERKKLISADQSISRQYFVRRSVFAREVAENGQRSKGQFVGVATVKAKEVRAISATKWPSADPRRICGFGLLDKVEDGDFDGHGTIGFLQDSKIPDTRELGAMREFLIFDLANRFSDIVTMDDALWSNLGKIAVGRVVSICRAATA
jgi:hypothetical protein